MTPASERRGLSSFLAEHQGCDKGFDIQRPQGPEAGLVRVTCNGCGEATEFLAGPESGISPPGDHDHDRKPRPPDRTP